MQLGTLPRTDWKSPSLAIMEAPLHSTPVLASRCVAQLTSHLCPGELRAGKLFEIVA